MTIGITRSITASTLLAKKIKRTERQKNKHGKNEETQATKAWVFLMLEQEQKADLKNIKRSSRSCKIDIFGIGCKGVASPGGAAP